MRLFGRIVPRHLEIFTWFQAGYIFKRQYKRGARLVAYQTGDRLYGIAAIVLGIVEIAACTPHPVEVQKRVEILPEEFG